MYQATIKQLEATNKVYSLRKEFNDIELAQKLELSKVTLYTRLKKNNWQEKEILLIEYHSNQYFKKIVKALEILKAEQFDPQGN